MTDRREEVVIKVDNLSKSFEYWTERTTSIKTFLVDAMKGKFDFGTKKRIEVLEDVSFEIKKHEFVGIMGRNGVGKSTILKLITGIYTPTSGSVTVNGNIAPLIELGAGFHPDLSGYENIFLNASILGFGREATKGALEEIVAFSELGDLIYMPVKNYSSGMMMRLGFSVATHLTSDILLVDEVLSVGDAGFQKKCLDKIHALHGIGKTVIIVTHDPNAVAEHCSRCIVLADKRKVFDGDSKQGAAIYLNAVMPS